MRMISGATFKNSDEPMDLSLGQAHELGIALMRAHCTPEDLTRLIQNEGLCRQVMAVLRGQVRVGPIIIPIAENEVGMLPDGFSLRDADQLDGRVRGSRQVEVEEIRLYKPWRQSNGEIVQGHWLLTELAHQPVLGLSCLLSIIRNAYCIPTPWIRHELQVIFWGSVLTDCEGRAHVPFLDCRVRNGVVFGRIVRLDADFGPTSPAAILGDPVNA